MSENRQSTGLSEDALSYSAVQGKLQRSVLILKYCIAAGILCLVTATVLFEYNSFRDSELNAGIADLVNLAGRQRMLSQRLGRLLELANTNDLDSEIRKEELQEARLRLAVEAEQLRGRINQFTPFLKNSLQRTLQDCNSLRSEILFQSDPQQINNQPTNANSTAIRRDVQLKIDRFLPEMETIVYAIVKHHADLIDKEKRRESASLIITSLLLIACFIPVTITSLRGLQGSVNALGKITQEKNRLAVIAEQTSNAVIVTDPKGLIEWVNAGFTRITEYTLEEVVGRKPGDLLQYEKTDPSAVQVLRGAIQQHKPANCQIQNISKSRREYWLEVNLTPLLDEKGVLNGFMAVETDITALKTNEHRLNEEKAFLNSILDSINSCIAIVSSAGELIASNSRWTEFYKSQDTKTNDSSVELVARNLVAFAHASDQETSCKLLSGVQNLLDGKSAYFEYEYSVPVAGQIRWFRLIASPCKRNNMTHAVIATEDITERIMDQKRIQAASDRANAIFEGSNDAFMLVRDGHFIDCNQKTLDLFGIKTKEAIITMHPSTFSPTRQPCGRMSADLANHRMQEASRLGSVCFEWIHQRIDGTTFPAEVLLSSIKLEGEMLLLASVRDISARKETLRYLEMYRSIVDRHAIVAETDTTGKILFANEQFCRISGFSHDEIIGSNHRILNSGLHPLSFWRDLFKTVANDETWHGEICNRSKDGSLYWVDTTIAALKNHDGKVRGYFAVRHDITALKRAREEAQAASETKSQFLANMSHEIRTPMTAILGFADLLADEVDKPGIKRECVEYVSTIKRNGEHLLCIINDILDISKIESGKMQVELITASPIQIIEEVMSLMRVKAIEKGINLISTLKDTIPLSIQSDPTRIRQILVNLVGNAIKFTDRGEVVLEVSYTDSSKPQLKFLVQDTGIGMTTEQVSRLFSAFSQADASTSRRFGGSGLGLQISKRLAQMLGGDISVTSVYQQGSKFEFTLNLDLKTTSFRSMNEISVGEIARRATNSKSSFEKSLEGVRILLAEDGIDNQRLISFHLKRAGAVVTIAENGRQAFDLLTIRNVNQETLALPSPFDLLLTDMQMPEMDGYSLARSLRAMGSTLPIIALTAHAMADDTKKCLDAGCNEHATKPIVAPQLIDVCRRWVDIRKEHSAL